MEKKMEAYSYWWIQSFLNKYLYPIYFHGYSSIMHFNLNNCFNKFAWFQKHNSLSRISSDYLLGGIGDFVWKLGVVELVLSLHGMFGMLKVLVWNVKTSSCDNESWMDISSSTRTYSIDSCFNLFNYLLSWLNLALWLGFWSSSSSSC